jgi:tight adherence protein C
MITTFEFQVVFYSLFALVAALPLKNYVRRRRRERLSSPSRHEALDRLGPWRLELQLTERLPIQSVPVEPPALAIVRLERATAPSANSTSTASVGNVPSYRPGAYQSTSWQDRQLFEAPTASQWRGSSAVPRVEPREVPTVRTNDYTYGSATPVLAAFLPETDEKRIKLARELKQAGYYEPHAHENLSATRFLFMFGSLLFGGVCVLFVPPALESPMLVGTLVLTGLGWAFPTLLVSSRARTRCSEIERAIPDMMDMLNMCVSQGLTVPDSLEHVAGDLKPVYPALAQELAIVVDQTKVGTLNEALQNFAERIDIPQVDSFVSLIVQTQRMGTSVSQALSDYSDHMRESLRQRADERANQASFALLFPTVICLMPAVFMFLMGPAVIELYKFTNSGGADALNQGRQALRGGNHLVQQRATDPNNP